MNVRLLSGALALCVGVLACSGGDPNEARGNTSEDTEPSRSGSELTVGPIPPLIYTHPSIDTTVVGMAMATTGLAYTWYRDGTATAGSLTSLDDHSSPYSYALPPGKTTYDIVGMAINSIDRVYTWYKDGTRSVGTSRTLDAYQAPAAYQLPYKPGSTVRYSPSEILEIAITPQDQVRTYFSDGTVAQGSSVDLGASWSGVAFQPAGGRAPGAILGIDYIKATGEAVSWYRDGHVARGSYANLGGTGDPYSQHLTIYSFKTGVAQSEPGGPIFEGNGPVELVRGDLGAIHEAIVAPGSGSVAAAHSYLSIFTKLGERVMFQAPGALFSDFLAGSSDPVRNLNTFSGLGDCANGYPQTRDGLGFCVSEAYDTRAAYDKIGNRFVFLSHSRNLVWETSGSAGECTSYIDPSGASVTTSSYCKTARRHVMLAVSVSENPADGFHLYAVKEANYRDWPALTVNDNQLIVTHKNSEDPAGYAAIVFDLEQMRAGAKRPRYFKLYPGDLGGDVTLSVPRIQDKNSALTLGIGSSGKVFGFSRGQVGYAKPSLIQGTGTLWASENWDYSLGALRIAKSASAGNGASKLQYGRYPVSVTASQITVKTTAADGAVPFGDLALPSSSIKSFDCPRLAVTNGGDEVIAFAGVRAGANSKVSYDAAFVARPSGQSAFGAPVSYATGANTDPTSSNTGSGLSYNADHCQQQGGAERDPEGWRVWMMHSYGLQGASLSLQGALGWVSFQ